MSPAPAQQACRELAANLFSHLRTAAEALVLNPEVRVEDHQLDALRSALSTGRLLVEGSTGPGRKMYAMKDASIEIRRDFDAAEHALMILQRLHGPQLAAAAPSVVE